MSYSSEGELLKPMIMHSGITPYKTEEKFEDKFIFCDSSNGKIHQGALLRQYLEIRR